MQKLIVILLVLQGGLLRAQDVEFTSTFRELTLPNGLVLDKTSNREVVSCASTGMVSYAKVLAAQQGHMPLDETVAEVRRGFYNTVEKNPPKNRGWLYHFTYVDGRPAPFTEVSTIDTAIFYYSFLKIGALLNDSKFSNDISARLASIDTQFMLSPDGYFHHGFYWHGEAVDKIQYRWETSDEGVLLYRLFGLTFKPTKRIVELPLFVYYYPLCFYSDAEQVALLKEAIQYQKKSFKYIGVTATDGPSGYQVGLKTVFSPLSVLAISGYCDIAKAELAAFPHRPTTAAFSENWVSKDKYGIDYGSCYILLSRAQAP